MERAVTEAIQAAECRPLPFELRATGKAAAAHSALHVASALS